LENSQPLAASRVTSSKADSGNRRQTAARGMAVTVKSPARPGLGKEGNLNSDQARRLR